MAAGAPCYPPAAMDDRHPGDPAGARPSGRGPRLHPVARVVLFLALFFVLQIAVGVPSLFIWAVLNDRNPMLLAQGQGVGGFSLFVYACLAPVVVALTIVLLRRLDGKAAAAIGARWPRGGLPVAARQAAASAGAVTALLGLWLALVAVFGEVVAGGVAAAFADGVGPLRGPGGGALALVLEGLAFFVQGGVEEWVFRGYVFHALRERWSWASAAGGSSVLFAVVHSLNPSVEPAGLVNTFLLGLVLAAVVELTGSLVAPTVLHGAWNYLMAGILSLPVSGTELFHLLDFELGGPDYLTGGAYGPEGSWVLTGLLLPILLVLVARVDRRRPPAA